MTNENAAAGDLRRAFQLAHRGVPVRRHRGSEAREVCESGELVEGGVVILALDRASVGVFRVAGSVYALRNECPHNGAELCRGHLSAVYPPEAVGFDLPEPQLAGRVLSCPLHGRQYDIVTGQALFDVQGSVLTYDAWEENGRVFVRV